MSIVVSFIVVSLVGVIPGRGWLRDFLELVDLAHQGIFIVSHKNLLCTIMDTELRRDLAVMVRQAVVVVIWFPSLVFVASMYL